MIEEIHTSLKSIIAKTNQPIVSNLCTVINRLLYIFSIGNTTTGPQTTNINQHKENRLLFTSYGAYCGAAYIPICKVQTVDFNYPI
jgi:hypothetical protein